MSQKSDWVILLLILCSTPSCSKPYGYKVPQAQFDLEIKTIAIAPLQGNPETFQPNRKNQQGFESILEAKLKASNFSVIPSKDIEGIWRTLVSDGEYQDNLIEGMSESERLRKIRMRTFKEIADAFQPDAILTPTILHLPIKFKLNQAKWDGAIQTVGDTASPFLEGTVSALSLEIIIQDIGTGKDLFTNRAGIQIASQFQRIAASRWAFIPIPQESLLGDEDRNLEAVNRALGPLTGK